MVYKKKKFVLVCSEDSTRGGDQTHHRQEVAGATRRTVAHICGMVRSCQGKPNVGANGGRDTMGWQVAIIKTIIGASGVTVAAVSRRPCDRHGAAKEAGEVPWKVQNQHGFTAKGVGGNELGTATRQYHEALST